MRDVTALRATAEPRFIREISAVARRETQTALRGMFQLSGT